MSISWFLVSTFYPPIAFHPDQQAFLRVMGATLRINALLLACKQSPWGDNEAMRSVAPQKPIDSMIRYTWIVRDRRLVLFQHPVQGCLYPRVLDVVAKTLLLLRIFQ